ncbi:MAG: hypothetical protein KDK07_23025 [Bauldia sp.]|nr:hypothetical protein [Bauldia sp.]
MLPSPSPPPDLWAITAYFNPVGFHRRLANYRAFRRHLQLPLATVELSFDGRFELDPDDADILVRVNGGDLMWQKERLLNLALAALPARCTKVAWLDCDLIFESPAWGRLTSDALDRMPLLQPFAQVLRTPPDWSPGMPLAAETQALRAIGALVEGGMTRDACLRGIAETIGAAHGMAWAARRSLLETHGFYDANIIGGGDSALLRAAFGYIGLLVERQKMNAPRERHYRAWAEPFHDAVRGQVGHVPGTVYHLWHGDPLLRQYVTRFDRFAACDYDPYHDVAVAPTGAWRWNSDKRDMHAFIRDYFHSRREDG